MEKIVKITELGYTCVTRFYSNQLEKAICSQVKA